MSRSIRQPIAPGSEWWGKRPVRYISKGAKDTWFWKRRLHKIERRAGREQAVEAAK